MDHTVHLNLVTTEGLVNPMEPHPSRKMKLERRAALFKAATHEFTQLGFEQASLNRIIGKVGMSKSSFYHYFTNKTELFQQIIEQTLEPLSKIGSAIEPETLTKDTFWPAILASTKGVNLMTQDNPEVFEVGRMFHRNLHQPNGLCEDMMTGPIALVTRVLEHGKVIGTIRDDLPSSLLLSSVMALGMAMDRWALDNIESLPAEEFAAFPEKAVKMFIRVLAPDED